MTVECEKCKTRFHVADARIPAKGARVRCSRCHHRFHITPSSAAPTQPRAEPQGSAEDAVLGGEAAREEDQLDHPEFLFDRPEDGRSKGDLTQPLQPDSVDRRPAQAHLAEPPEAKTPAPPPEERVVSSGGVTAQQLLDEGDPKLPTGRFDRGLSLGETNSLIGDPEDASASGARVASAEGPIGSDEPLALVPHARPASADIAAIAAELGEDEDTSFADWDPLALPSSPPAGASADAPTRAAKLAPDPVKPQPAARPKRRALNEAPAFDPEAASPIGLILQVAAVVVGLLLVGAAGRLLWLQRERTPSEPQVVQAAGWIAADLDTFLARNADGERVVVIRGNLFPEGSAPPPSVEVRLLGVDGEPLLVSPRTWLERIDDAEVAPERLELRLAGTGAEIGGIGPQVTGFTAVVPDPPPGVRSVEVSLRAPERSPSGTATADLPSESPVVEPPTEAAPPSPAAQPAAPGSEPVLPAAPEPE